MAIATAHQELCDGPPHLGRVSAHPGDPFGRVPAWLWRTGQYANATQLVVDYLAEQRRHHPNAPEEGSRLTWRHLRQGLPLAINTPYELETDQVVELLEHLDTHVPSFYGLPASELDKP